MNLLTDYKTISIMRYIISFLVLFVFWVIISGVFKPFYLILGALSALIVTWWSGDLLVAEKNLPIGNRLLILFRFFNYSVWLLYQIFLANLHVVWVALHPNLNEILEPSMIEFESELKSDLERFILANSITLTPGTVTVRIEDGVFLVHSLTRQTAEGVPGEMEERIKYIFAGGRHA